MDYINSAQIVQILFQILIFRLKKYKWQTFAIVQ